MSTKTKALPLDPPATEAELERASQIWTAAHDVMVARGFGRHLWGCQSAAGHEFMVLMLREVEVHITALRTKNAVLEAQIHEYKRVTSDLANRLREQGTADDIGTGANR